MYGKKGNFKRTQIQFTEKQHESLTQEAAEKNISLSELLRRIVDKYIETSVRAGE